MYTRSNNYKLFNVAKEFNIGLKTLLEFLDRAEFDITGLNNPNSILNQDMYDAVKAEFEYDRLLKVASLQIEPAKLNVNKQNREVNISYVNSLIQTCIETSSITLDLGRCGLDSDDFLKGSELDINLRKCKHIEKLILSNGWWTWKGRKQWWSINNSINAGNNNFFKAIPDAVEELVNLKTLIACGEMNNPWDIRMEHRILCNGSRQRPIQIWHC